ncbi:MAG: C-terminal target protein [Flavisolibacter sp.]|nr:C-terminal target protein [Flavisolibacter sp.]
MRKVTLLFLLSLSVQAGYAQVFSDNFNRVNSVIVGNGWTELETAATGAQISSNRLQLGSTTAGREFVLQDVSTLYSTNGISTNTATIVWAFNFRNTRTDPSGFANNSYGLAFILGKTTIATTDGNGYAIVIGQSGSSDLIRLTSFSNGPDADANFTNIISGNDYGSDYISVKVIYNPATDEWSLFAESNASAFPQANPYLTSTQIGTTTVNATYTTTGNDLKYIGAFWNHATGASDNAIFDDVTVTLVPTNYYPKTSATNLSLVNNWTTDPTGIAGTSPINFTSPYQLFNLNNNVANPVVSTAWTISGGSNLILNNTNSLLFTPAASFTLGTGSSADFNSKPVTLKSNASGTAFIGTITGTLSNATNVTVERYISSDNNRAYRLLAPTVNTITPIRTNWQENGVSTSELGTHITGSISGANGFDITQSGQASVFTYDAVTPAWVALSNTNVNTLNAKTGYLTFIRGDRTINLTSTASPLPSNNTTLRATGTLLTGPQSFTGLIGSSKFNLVTNPYAAPINWASVYTASTGISQYYTLWDPNIGSRGAFVTVNTIGTKSNNSSNATINIQSGQAFFIKASEAAAPTVNIAETHKSLVNNIDIFRAGLQTELFNSSLYYTDQFNNRINADGVISVYNNNYTDAIDENDADQIPNWDEDIAISRSTNELSIESRALIDIADTILFTLARLKVQSYEWQFDATDFNQPNLQATLVDKFLNTRTLVSLNGSTVVPFTITNDGASAAADRFMVVFGLINVLPVNLSSVKAFQKIKDVQVEWTANTEINMDRYEVEKSMNGQQFSKAASVAARGNNSSGIYDWLDVNPANGNHYYRIKVISKTGEVQYSKIVKVTVGISRSSITAYPNPVKDNIVSLSWNLPKGNYRITLTNKLGQQVFSREIKHSGGSATQTLELGNNFLLGVYQLCVSNGEEKYVQQLIRN